MDAFRKTFGFVVGALIVVFSVLDNCPRVGAIAVGLLMMGVFSVEEAIKFFRGPSTQGGRDGSNHTDDN